MKMIKLRNGLSFDADRDVWDFSNRYFTDSDLETIIPAILDSKNVKKIKLAGSYLDTIPAKFKQALLESNITEVTLNASRVLYKTRDVIKSIEDLDVICEVNALFLELESVLSDLNKKIADEEFNKLNQLDKLVELYAAIVQTKLKFKFLPAAKNNLLIESHNLLDKFLIPHLLQLQKDGLKKRVDFILWRLHIIDPKFPFRETDDSKLQERQQQVVDIENKKQELERSLNNRVRTNTLRHLKDVLPLLDDPEYSEWMCEKLLNYDMGILDLSERCKLIAQIGKAIENYNYSELEDQYNELMQQVFLKSLKRIRQFASYDYKEYVSEISTLIKLVSPPFDPTFTLLKYFRENLEKNKFLSPVKRFYLYKQNFLNSPHETEQDKILLLRSSFLGHLRDFIDDVNVDIKLRNDAKQLTAYLTNKNLSFEQIALKISVLAKSNNDLTDLISGFLLRCFPEKKGSTAEKIMAALIEIYGRNIPSLVTKQQTIWFSQAKHDELFSQWLPQILLIAENIKDSDLSSLKKIGSKDLRSEIINHIAESKNLQELYDAARNLLSKCTRIRSTFGTKGQVQILLEHMITEMESLKSPKESEKEIEACFGKRIHAELLNNRLKNTQREFAKIKTAMCDLTLWWNDPVVGIDVVGTLNVNKVNAFYDDLVSFADVTDENDVSKIEEFFNKYKIIMDQIREEYVQAIKSPQKADNKAMLALNKLIPIVEEYKKENHAIYIHRLKMDNFLAKLEKATSNPHLTQKDVKAFITEFKKIKAEVKEFSPNDQLQDVSSLINAITILKNEFDDMVGGERNNYVGLIAYRDKNANNNNNLGICDGPTPLMTNALNEFDQKLSDLYDVAAQLKSDTSFDSEAFQNILSEYQKLISSEALKEFRGECVKSLEFNAGEQEDRDTNVDKLQAEVDKHDLYARNLLQITSSLIRKFQADPDVKNQLIKIKRQILREQEEAKTDLSVLTQLHDQLKDIRLGLINKPIQISNDGLFGRQNNNIEPSQVINEEQLKRKASAKKQQPLSG